MPTDLDALQGSWNLVEVELDGAAIPAPGLEGAQVVVKGNTFQSLGMSGTYEGTVEIDQTAKPKRFDLVITKGHAAGTRNLGIYKLKGDSWTLCLSTRGTERPKLFATKPDTGLALEVFERTTTSKAAAKAKSEAKAAPAPPAAAPTLDVASGPATALEGEWAMTAGVFNGVAMAANMVKWAKRVTRGDVTMVVAGPQVMLKATFFLDLTGQRGNIDYVNIEGPNRGKSQAGIVEFDGDTVAVCMAAPGQPRPSKLESKPGDQRSFTTWRLVAK